MLAAGKIAPDFTLEGVDGKSHSLAAALKNGPVLLAFFKISCPVCQFTFPYIERLFEKYGNSKVTVWGVSQDDAQDRSSFARNLTFRFCSSSMRMAIRFRTAMGLRMFPLCF